MFFRSDKPKVVADALGYLRVAIAKELDMIDKSQFAFVWVVDWPLFEYSEEFERYIADTIHSRCQMKKILNY